MIPLRNKIGKVEIKLHKDTNFDDFCKGPASIVEHTVGAPYKANFLKAVVGITEKDGDFCPNLCLFYTTETFEGENSNDDAQWDIVLVSEHYDGEEYTPRDGSYKYVDTVYFDRLSNNQLLPIGLEKPPGPFFCHIFAVRK